MVEAAARPGRFPELAKFEILEEIGRGGMATVYRACDRRLGREVALKVIHPHLRDSLEVASRFYAEAKAVAKLRHPNIVEVYDVSESDEREQYLVAELVRGTTLRRLEQQRGPFPPEVAAIIALELLDALAHANGSGVVHRDVKPENVLIAHAPPADGVDRFATEGARLRVAVKLTDFGIAKLLDAQGVTSTGQVLGSPSHMAPEQIEGGEVDARSDVFGMGVLLYECMVGHLPFEGANPAQVLRRVLHGSYPPAHTERPLVGSRWSAIVDRALAHEPDDRFEDAGAMRRALVAELERLGFPAAPLIEVQAWLDDQEGYERAYAAALPARLRALGEEARRRRDVLSAASDFNRALAFTPDDPALIRIVLGLGRARARARFARLAGASAGAATMLAAGALVLARNLPVERLRAASPSGSAEANSVSAPAPLSTRPPALAVTEPSAGLSDAGSIKTAADSPSGGDEAPPLAQVPRATAVRVHETGAPRALERTLTLDLRPPMGLTLTVDSAPPRPVVTGESLSLDGSAHALVFECPVCVMLRVSVPAGDRSEPLVVSVPIKPATLVVEGDLGKTYQVSEHPELGIRAGANTVAIRSAFERVTIHQVETGAAVSVRLEAGKSVHVRFEGGG